jgi:hypothetical protein
MKHTKAIGLGLLFTLGAALAGCGQQAYIATASQEALSAPGTFTVPAKVDLLLVEDDTGSMSEVFPQVKDGIKNVVNNLEAIGWDYHLATIPLTTYRTLSQVAASHYDGNWGSDWKAPFPGAVQYGPQTVSPYVFRKTDSYSDAPTSVNYNNGLEPGLQNILYSLGHIKGDGTNFFRDDAMLVILMVGNGNDTSGISYCDRGDGVVIPCGTSTSIDDIKTGLIGLKGNSALIRFYSIVSSVTVNQSPTCQGNYAYAGTRYIQMANALNGKAYDLCSGGASAIPTALNSLASDLTSVRVALQTRYLPIAQEPDTSTIVVTRSDKVVIPQSATNGWTYAGYLNGAYAIDYPVPMNQFSGYAIELHGSYKLTGTQNATVTYTPKGLHNSN